MNSSVKRKLDDATLIHGLNNRQERAIEEVFHRLYPSLCWFANKLIDDREATRDVVQEVFVRFYEKRNNRFESFSGVMSFLYNSVHNEAIDYLRRSKRTVHITADSADEAGGADALLYVEQESIVFMKIFQEIDKLPDKMREIFILSYVDRLSVRQISTQLGIAETTVKTQRQRAKQYLKDQLKDYVQLLSLLFF